jgi:hypothetical protein
LPGRRFERIVVAVFGGREQWDMDRDSVFERFSAAFRVYFNAACAALPTVLAVSEKTVELRQLFRADRLPARSGETP